MLYVWSVLFFKRVINKLLHIKSLISITVYSLVFNTIALTCLNTSSFGKKYSIKELVNKNNNMLLTCDNLHILVNRYFLGIGNSR